MQMVADMSNKNNSWFCKNMWKVHLQKQKNHVFSLCIPINLNQTAVGLYYLFLQISSSCVVSDSD